jgi:hypothetical protein
MCCFVHRYLGKVDCSSIVMFHRLALPLLQTFLQEALTVLTRQTRQALHAINQSIFLNVYGPTSVFCRIFSEKKFGTFKLSTRNLNRLNYFNMGSIANKLKQTEQNLGRVFNSRFGQTGLTNPSVNKIKTT